MTPATLLQRHGATGPRLLVLACVAAAAWFGDDRLGPNLLLSGVFLAGAGAGTLFFMAVSVATRARWDESLRPLAAAAFTRLVPIATLLLALALWARPETPAGASAWPAAWLTREFLLARSVAYAGLWWLGARAVQQPRASQGTAAVVLIMLALTGWLAASDWLLSLMPGWISTIYGVYVFVGFVVSALAAILFGCVVERVRTPTSGRITDAHLHDLATLLFGLSCVWMYLWYSQYMLIWYTNQPHETAFYVLRTGPAWQGYFWAMVTLKGVVPFALLLSRAGKSDLRVLSAAAASVLAGHWLELYVTILPATSAAASAPGRTEAAFIVALIGAVGAALVARPSSTENR
jgi:Ni/Fe-hydrogenase subunit HybB-like protein